jgi:hypothetical protein
MTGLRRIIRTSSAITIRSHPRISTTATATQIPGYYISHLVYDWTMDEGTIKTPVPKCRLYWCFCLGWCSSFVGSESGQKQSLKLLQNMVYNTTQHPTTPYIQCGRGGGGQRERRGATVHKEKSKIPTWLTESSV